MKTDTPVPSQVNALVIQDWHATTIRPEGVHLITTLIEEAAPHKVSWLLCYLWAAVRTEFFTAQCYRAHLDVANLGGHYYSYRASVRDACEEFAKFEDTSMLQEEDRILAELKSLMTHAMSVNPGGEPLPEPPRTVPVPMPLPPLPTPAPAPEPQPEPEEPKPSEPPAQWKSKFKWLSLVASLALNLYFLWGNLVPPVVGSTIKVLLEAIKGYFS
jgi:hypothetical protein